MADPKLTLVDRRKAAEARKQAAEAAYTPEKRAEAEERAEIERIESEAAALEAKDRAHDLAKREEAARYALGPSIPIASMSSDVAGCAHTFIVMHVPEAFKTWESAIATATLAARQNPSKAADAAEDRARAGREYAMAAVYDWNGETDLHAATSEKGGEFLDLMKGFPGLVTSITIKASELAGYALEARKS